MTRYGFQFTVLLLGTVAVMAAGCRRAEFTFYPVEGTVTKAGRPLCGVEVVFLADPESATVGPRASGKTDEAGHYRLRTDRGDDGTVTGKHLVLILAPEGIEAQFLRSLRSQPPTNETTRQSPEMAKRLEEQLKRAGDA